MTLKRNAEALDPAPKTDHAPDRPVVRLLASEHAFELFLACISQNAVTGLNRFVQRRTKTLRSIFARPDFFGSDKPHLIRSVENVLRHDAAQACAQDRFGPARPDLKLVRQPKCELDQA